MKHPHVDRLGAIAFLVLGAGACATTMKPPATNSGPALSSSGVELAVVGQACQESYLGTMEQWLDETVQLQVRNGSGEPVSIHRDQFRLLAPDGTVFAGRNSSTDPVQIAKGETQTIELTFSTRGLDCSQAMRLDPAAAITAGASRVVLGSVSFVPSRAL